MTTYDFENNGRKIVRGDFREYNRSPKNKKGISAFEVCIGNVNTVLASAAITSSFGLDGVLPFVVFSVLCVVIGRCLSSFFLTA